MLWPLCFLCLVLLGRLAATRLCIDHRYPAWRARRRTAGRSAGYLAFAMLHASPFFDGQGFLDWYHPDNRRERLRFVMVGAVFIVLAPLAF